MVTTRIDDFIAPVLGFEFLDQSGRARRESNFSRSIAADHEPVRNLILVGRAEAALLTLDR